MKIKSFAMLAMSGLLAASFAYIAPAMADDSSTGSGQSQSGSSDNSMQNSDSGSSQSDTGSSGSGSNVGSSDEASPDTATGDDDY